MSATGGAIPTDEGATLQQRVWWRQIQLAVRSLLHASEYPGPFGFQLFVYVFIGLLPIAATLIPVITFFRYLRSGILFLSPPLLFMFLAGLAALPLAKTSLWDGPDIPAKNPVEKAEGGRAAQW